MRQVAIGGCLATTVISYLTFRTQPTPSPEGPAYQKLPQTPYDRHANQHFLTKIPRTIGIIGGGSAGLVTAKVLSEQGFQVEVLEKNSRTGGVWAENYEGAGLQGPFPHFNMPDHVFPPGTPMFPKLDIVREFLDSYIERFNLAPLVSLNSEVEEVTQTPDGGWTVGLKGGGVKKYDFLVLSTGQFYRPHIPAIPGLASFTGKSIHSFDLRNAKVLCGGKRVVVIGGGKSGFDAMNVSSESGGTVTGVVRKRIWAAQLDRTLFGYPLFVLVTNRLSGLLNPAPEQPHTWLSTVLKPVADLYYGTLCKEMRAGLPDSLMPETDLRTQRNNIIIARDQEVVSKVVSGQIQIVNGEVDRVVPEGIVVAGKTIPADLLVFATGFEKNTLSLTERDMWLYRGVLLPAVRNFAAIGYGSFVFNQLKHNLQAVWLAEVFRGTVRLPSIEDMKGEVAARKGVVEKVYSEYPASAPYAWSELTYYDSLLRDMGLQTRRKTSVFSDLLDMPDPTDYKSVVTHRL